MVQDRVRLTNLITAARKACFPQVLDWFRNKDVAVFANFVQRCPTLELAQRARNETLSAFFREHNIRYQSTIDRRLAAIRAEQPLTHDVAVIHPTRLLVETLLPQLRAASAGIERFDEEIARLCPELPDYALFQMLPGAGVAPVTERSGNKSSVHWRYACPTFLRQTFIEWAGQTIPRSFGAQAFYRGCRAHGMRHQAALRALAFKWIRILHRCWVDRTPYDEARYLMALQKRQAPLLRFAVASSAQPAGTSS